MNRGRRLHRKQDLARRQHQRAVSAATLHPRPGMTISEWAALAPTRQVTRSELGQVVELVVRAVALARQSGEGQVIP